MSNSKTSVLVLCSLCVCINITLGSFVTYAGIPFLFLDAIGTIFIATNFKLRYGILTGLTTNLVLGMIHGPLALPFGLVSLTIALVSHFAAKKSFGLGKAILTGILLVLIGSLVSAPIRLILYGGFGGVNPSAGDILVFSMGASGRQMLRAAYFGAVVDGILDKVISCVLVSILNKSFASALARFPQRIDSYE